VYDEIAKALKRSGDTRGASMKVTGITPILNVSDAAASVALVRAARLWLRLHARSA
jgi:hypothetical protein